MNESQVFANALKLSGAAERAAYLDEACGGDLQLRADVEALLQAHADDPDFLEPPAASLSGTEEASPTGGAPANAPAAAALADGHGLVLAGRYQLLEEIGEGGMGTVWVAEQLQPVRRKVAAKLIKAGMDSRQALARFEAERQALARMDHPHIAKVFDAGYVGQAFQPDSAVKSQAGKPDLPHGRPYFVMELVKGVPITRYCDEHRLTLRRDETASGGVRRRLGCRSPAIATSTV